MSHTLKISESLHQRLETTTRNLGFQTVAELLEFWQNREDELRDREQSVQKIDNLRNQLFAVNGELPDQGCCKVRAKHKAQAAKREQDRAQRDDGRWWARDNGVGGVRQGQAGGGRPWVGRQARRVSDSGLGERRPGEHPAKGSQWPRG